MEKGIEDLLELMGMDEHDEGRCFFGMDELVKKI